MQESMSLKYEPSSEPQQQAQQDDIMADKDDKVSDIDEDDKEPTTPVRPFNPQHQTLKHQTLKPQPPNPKFLNAKPSTLNLES